jgi:hypothetical protein
MVQKDVHMTHIIIQNYNTSNSCRQPTISSCCYFVCTKNLDDCLASFYSNLILWFRKVAKHVGDLLHLVFFFQICVVNSSRNLLLDSFACSFFSSPSIYCIPGFLMCRTGFRGSSVQCPVPHSQLVAEQPRTECEPAFWRQNVGLPATRFFFASARQKR